MSTVLQYSMYLQYSEKTFYRLFCPSSYSLPCTGNLTTCTTSIQNLSTTQMLRKVYHYQWYGLQLCTTVHTFYKGYLQRYSVHSLLWVIFFNLCEIERTSARNIIWGTFKGIYIFSLPAPPSVSIRVFTTIFS